MVPRFALLALCLAGTVSAAILARPEKGERAAVQPLAFHPAGNLQVGAPGELLPDPIGVRTRPGAPVRFFSPDLGLIEESGAAEATVQADATGWARVHVRLGENLGRYTVVASPAAGEGPDALYTFRAISAEAMQTRRTTLAEAAAKAAAQVGGAR